MKFNKSQQSAIEHKDGAMLVLAGPGSGKTAVITQRTKNLITNHHVDPTKILVITFTKAAANEMKERFNNLMQDEYVNVSFGTFHAVFFTVLKHAYRFGKENIATDEMKYRFMREILSHYSLEYKDENEFIGNIFAEISCIKNGRIAIENFYSGVCGEEIFRNVYKDYEKRLRNSRLIDFDDMLTYTYELFTQRPDILKLWQNKYEYILIDEFQDINQIQYEIVKMMALPQNNIFIVGDDDQSIYRFRGSRPEIMLNFDKDYPDAKRVLLDTNYRCGKYIVETSINLISHNKERFEKKIVAASDSQQPIQYVQFENRRDENFYLLKDIEKKLQEGAKLSDFAVLFRTNTQPRALMELLMSYNIPFKTKDNVPNVYEHWIARDIFTYQRIAAGSRKRSDFLSIMNRPKRYLSRTSLCDSTVDFDEWIKLFDEQPWVAERIEKLESDLMLMSHMNPYASINYIRRGIGYDDFLAEYADYRNMNKEDLYEIIDEIQALSKGFATFEEWKKHIDEYSKELMVLAQKKIRDPNAVTLATFHSSKGLEFENVYLIDVNEKIVPYKKAVMEKDIEEERRLFYVGMTRAKTNLSIYSVKALNDKTSQVSRFVKETKEHFD